MDTSLKTKPSCPKEFFAKLYGHLEDNDKKLDQNENSNSDEQINLNCKKSENKDSSSFNGKNLINEREVLQRFQPPFPFLPAVIARNGPGFCAETAFTAGFTAFRK